MDIGGLMLGMVKFIVGAGVTLVVGVIAYLVYLNRSQMRGM